MFICWQSSVNFFCFRWNFDLGEYVPVVFEEVMIDHLEIKSSTVLAESMDGKEQIVKYGIPVPEEGKICINDIILNYSI